MLKFDKIGPERGRRGSEWAHTQSQRSHGLQEGFWIPPGPPGHPIIFKNGPKHDKSENFDFLGCFTF